MVSGDVPVIDQQSDRLKKRKFVRLRNSMFFPIVLPSGNLIIALENGYRNSEFSHSTWRIFSW